MAVTLKKRLFAQHFAKHSDRQAAVLAAGYDAKDWPRTATRLLGDDEVLAIIQKRHERELSKLDVSTLNEAWVLEQMVDQLERIRACGMGSWQTQAETKILEMMGKRLGMFSERVEVGLDQKFIQVLQDGRERARQAALKSATVIVANEIQNEAKDTEE
jgi:hypothetical protein